MGCYYKSKSKEELEKIVEESKTFAEVMKKLGYSGNRGNSIKGLKKYLDSFGIDYSRFSKNNILNFSHPKKELDELLVKDCEYTNFTRLKKRIMRENLLGDKCSVCGTKDWMGKPLVLQVDHINGDNRDNRLENLRLLCPNCHSQTDTFCRKKTGLKEKKYCEKCGVEVSQSNRSGLCEKCANDSRKKIEWPNKEELFNLLKSGNFESVGRMLGVSGNSVRKKCRKYGIPDNSDFYKK